MSDILKGKWSKVEASSFKVINTGMDADMIVAVIIERVQGCNNTTCYMSFFFFGNTFVYGNRGCGHYMCH